MFDKLRKAFSSAAKTIGQKEISEKILDNTLLDLQIALLEADVAQEVVDSLSSALKQDLLGLKLEKGQVAEDIIQSRFRQQVASIFAKAGRFDLLDKIKSKKSAKGGPFSIVFLGINGTGKTTTVAKVANLLRKNGLSVVVAAGDTHRAGAIEQLTQHCERLSVKVIAQRYGSDPSAVGRDAQEYARKHYVDVVLVDTAGRMQTSKNLMDEMSKIVRVVKPDARLFIGDSLAGNDTINQAREFFQYTHFDGAILTKVDADAKGGSAISIAHITSKPITFIGIGQGYDDLIPFDADKFMATLFGNASEVTVESLMSASTTGISEFKEEIVPPEQAPLQHAREYAKQGAAPFVAAAQKDNVTPEIREPIQPEPSPQVQASNSMNELERIQKSHEEKLTTPEQSAKEPVEKIVKKSRFGFFGRKDKSDEDHKRDEKQIDQNTQPKKDDAIRKEKDVIKKRKEDKDNTGQKDEVIYLSDEDIEDLLK